MTKNGCTFCRIVAGELPAHVIQENERVIAFLSRSNHPLTISKEQVPDIYAMPLDVGTAVMEATIEIARAVKASLLCDGVYLTQANGAAAGQDVFHYHLHVYPCWGDKAKVAISDFVRRVTEKGVTEELRAETAQKVRAAL
jgi:histidine triad (HIT) family protein